MTATHTPRPWRANGRRIEFGPLVAGEGWAVATLLRDGSTAEQVEANARLIAAAPELLAALAAVVFADDECVRDTTMPIWRDAIRHARKAIAKAKGETP